MNHILKKVPVPIAGLMLALAAIGNLVLSYGELYRNLFGILSSIVLLLILGKIIINFKEILEDIKNPVMASIAPTFAMGIMILSTYINKFMPSIGFLTWAVGLGLHCLLIIYFTLKFVLNFDINKVLPSYFIVYVGIVVGSITAPAYNLAKLGEYIFWFGFLCYIILLPIVIYRVFCIKNIPEPVLPTIIIFAAPASLSLTGYLASFQEKSMTMVSLLGMLSIIMFVLAISYLPKLLKLKFYPSYSAFTFPLVISAMAMKQTNGFLLKQSILIRPLEYLAYLQLILSICIVFYVLYKYTIFLFENCEKSQAINKIKNYQK